MPAAQLYFLSDQYYIDFPDDKLMKNKDVINGIPHSRPCFFAFSDSQNSDIYWIVPISSKYDKYKRIEQDKIKKYGRCNTIRFGIVLGRNSAFLIQNMCPATIRYLTAYTDKNNMPIQIDNRVATDVKKNAHDVLSMVRHGANIVFPDIFKIYSKLIQQLQRENSKNQSRPTEEKIPADSEKGQQMLTGIFGRKAIAERAQKIHSKPSERSTPDKNKSQEIE